MGFGRGKGFTSKVKKPGTKFTIAVGRASVAKPTSSKLTTSVVLEVTAP